MPTDAMESLLWRMDEGRDLRRVVALYAIPSDFRQIFQKPQKQSLYYWQWEGCYAWAKDPIVVLPRHLSAAMAAAKVGLTQKWLASIYSLFIREVRSHRRLITWEGHREGDDAMLGRDGWEMTSGDTVASATMHTEASDASLLNFALANLHMVFSARAGAYVLGGVGDITEHTDALLHARLLFGSPPMFAVDVDGKIDILRGGALRRTEISRARDKNYSAFSEEKQGIAPRPHPQWRGDEWKFDDSEEAELPLPREVYDYENWRKTYGTASQITNRKEETHDNQQRARAILDSLQRLGPFSATRLSDETWKLENPGFADGGKRLALVLYIPLLTPINKGAKWQRVW